MKKIVYFDMDNVLVDFKSALIDIDQSVLNEYEDRYDEIPNIFSKMKPIPKAVESFNILSEHYDVYILSTATWNNPSAWSDKLEWVKTYLGKNGYKRLILSHYKNLNIGDFLIDDRLKNGADKFTGYHIHFGTDKFPDWDSVLKFLVK